MRPIDADACPKLFDAKFKETKRLILAGEKHLDNLAEGFMEATNVIRSMPTIAPPPNDPLTLEELREMDGEPVWIETADIKKANRWAFVDVGCEIVRFFDTRCGVKCTVMGNHFRTYGKTWLAYRRRPEASANAE